ncbi:MAG: hypothetical protein IT330_00195, partial [Anaerolineae bacterium]|nr:hypothetical protein [Anaerolineae bacterium]
ADYDSFFEFVIGNGEMMGRVDALHSQHLRHGAKKDVLCVRLVDLWGERTYPIHRGRPGGRFISKLEDESRHTVSPEDLTRYEQTLDPKTGILHTGYVWKKDEASGKNRSSGFMSKVRPHVMAQKYIDRTSEDGWTRSFAVETIFPHHSRASVFYIKKPYNPKAWAWGEVEHENEIEPVNNAQVEYDPARNIGTVTFSTEFPPLKTQVVWAVIPSPQPDAWEIDQEKGSLIFRWNLAPHEERETTVVAAVLTDRDATDCTERAKEEAQKALAAGWAGMEQEQVEWWRAELGKSSITIPDERFQTLYDVSKYYLLNSVGGSYWGFIGVDNVVYETCMCDNPIMLHALVETNHLEAARRELELLDKYLPAARKNAADRMRVVLGIENHDAALLPFYMTEDGVELWQDNVMGMYTSMSAFHTLSLLKTGRYLADDDYLRSHVYPWLRGYAEYGRLHAAWDKGRDAYIFPIENVGGGGEGLWARVTMSPRLYRRIFAESEPMFRFADFPPIEFFPKEEIAKLSPNWLDAVLNFRWIMEEATRYAERFGVDAGLRAQWRNVAANLHVPQNDDFFLSNTGSDAVPSIGGAAVGGLFWPAEGIFEDYDPEKVQRTVQEVVEQRHIHGLLQRKNKAWDAVYGFSFAYMGLGEEAYQCLMAFEQAADQRGIEMREGLERQNYYYLLNHGSLVLLTRYMVLQTYRGKIRVFPALPAKWRRRGVAFANLPAEGGYVVSGRVNGTSAEVEISDQKGDRIMMLSGHFPSLEIVPTRLRPEEAEREFALLGTEAQVEIRLFGVRQGERYAVHAGEEKQILTADGDLRFRARAPASVRVVAAG